jgi:type IV pilus assembly protein PilO
MAFNLSKIKTVPLYLKIIIAVVPSLILIILFIFLIYNPQNKEINALQGTIAKLDRDIANSEVKVRKLDELKAENKRLKALLAALKEQLPEEKEVSTLLRQISDLGLESGLEILLWKPLDRRPDPEGLYIEIPVQVVTIGAYHNLGLFYSHVSNIKRIVNLSGIKIVGHKAKAGEEAIRADFIASTFSAVTP